MLKFIQNFEINKLILPELASGRVGLAELTPSHGVPGLTNDVVENARAELLEIISALMLLEYEPESIDSFQINQERIKHVTYQATHKDQTNESLWFGTHGQSLASQIGPKPLFDPAVHRRSERDTANEFPHILPDSWSFYVGHKHEGTQTNWNTGYGIPSLIFNPGTLTIMPILGDNPKPLHNTDKKKDSSWGNAQLHNIFSCELHHSTAVKLVKPKPYNSMCMDISQSDPAINLPIMPKFPNQNRKMYCHGFVTLLGPVYTAPRSCKDNVMNSTPGMPFFGGDFRNCEQTELGYYFTGGTNPASQACHVDSTRNRYAAHAIVPTNNKNTQDPCKYSSERIKKPSQKLCRTWELQQHPYPTIVGSSSIYWW